MKLDASIQLASMAAAATAAAACYFVFWRTKPSAQRRRVVFVASTAAQKLGAAERALGGETAGFECPSLVSDQPVGFDETLRGAKNRLASLLGQLGEAPEVDLVVSIESGLIKSLVSEEETWIDVAVVLVRDMSTGAESVATSAGVRVPTEYVGTWAEAGGEGTVGDVIAEELGGDKHDPHGALTKGAFARSALLEHAIRVAASTMRVPTADPGGPSDD
jgi:non-canonical (house-cleaning) NTP pyrophosphatase